VTGNHAGRQTLPPCKVVQRRQQKKGSKNLQSQFSSFLNPLQQLYIRLILPASGDLPEKQSLGVRQH
jgi:hypothetical protein